MNRYELLRDVFLKKKFFKLVCGAGNEDLTEVRRLATIYTLAGVAMHDLSANPDVVSAAKEGVNAAIKMAETLGRKILMVPYLNVSIGIKGDPHVRKARIDKEVCTQCGECTGACRQEAIGEDMKIVEYRCIGCGDCEKACPAGAIEFFHRKADFDRILPECARMGVETMELHAVSEDDDSVMRDWKLLNGIIRENYVSVCIDRSLLSNRRLVDRISKMHEIAGERLIVQADGVPMSGEGDDFNTTLQAVACADVVMKSGIPAMVLLSGGTNSKTGVLARQCGVHAHGVAIGSYARKIVRHLVARDDFDTDIDVLVSALTIAEDLVCANLDALHD